MAVGVIWSPDAREDLKEILFRIRRENPNAAHSFQDSIRDKVGLLVRFPQLGRVVPEHEDLSLREIIYRPYRIIYLHRAHKNSIEIVRIWHAARGEPEI